MKYKEAKFPTIWASYLINGDASGLTEEDIKLCDETMAEYKDTPYCTNVSDTSQFTQFKGIGQEVSSYLLTSLKTYQEAYEEQMKINKELQEENNELFSENSHLKVENDNLKEINTELKKA